MSATFATFYGSAVVSKRSKHPLGPVRVLEGDPGDERAPLLVTVECYMMQPPRARSRDKYIPFEALFSGHTARQVLRRLRPGIAFSFSAELAQERYETTSGVPGFTLKAINTRVIAFIESAA